MVELRSFTLDDADALQRLHDRETPPDVIRRTICEWGRLEYGGKYFEMLAVTDGDELVGELSLYEHSASVVSIGLEIYPGYRRRGYGRQAFGQALEICKEKGYKIVCDQVSAENEASIALHKRLGFGSDLYRYRNQKGKDVYLFLRSLV